MTFYETIKTNNKKSFLSKGDKNLDKKGWAGIILEFILLNYFLLILSLKRYNYEDWGTHQNPQTIELLDPGGTG